MFVALTFLHLQMDADARAGSRGRIVAGLANVLALVLQLNDKTEQFSCISNSYLKQTVCFLHLDIGNLQTPAVVDGAGRQRPTERSHPAHLGAQRTLVAAPEDHFVACEKMHSD